MSDLNLAPFMELARSLAQTAMSIVGDLAVAVIYTPAGTLVYDPVGGGTTNSSNSLPLFFGVLTRFTTEEMNETNNSMSARKLSVIVKPTDAKLICAALDMGIQPTIKDTLVTIDSTTQGYPVRKSWIVARVLTLPGNPMFKLHIRET